MAGGLVNLGMIGGSPQAKVPRVIGEHMPMIKALDGGGGLGGLMNSVLGGGGMQSMLPNLMSGGIGNLQGVIGQVAGQLGSVSGAGSLIQALQGGGGSAGLAGAAAALQASGTQLLSGGGIMNMMSVSNIADMAGSALPQGLGIDAVLGPLNADPQISTIAAALPGVAARVEAGTMSVASATAWVDTQSAALDTVVRKSAEAIDGINAVAVDVSAVSTVAALYLSGPPAIRSVLARYLPPSVKAQIVASLEARSTDPDNPEILADLRRRLDPDAVA